MAFSFFSFILSFYHILQYLTSFPSFSFPLFTCGIFLYFPLSLFLYTRESYFYSPVFPFLFVYIPHSYSLPPPPPPCFTVNIPTLFFPLSSFFFYIRKSLSILLFLLSDIRHSHSSYPFFTFNILTLSSPACLSAR